MSTIATDYMELALVLDEEFSYAKNTGGVNPSAETPHRRQVVADVRELILASRRLHRFAEDDCNRGLTKPEQEQVDSIQARMAKLLSKYGVEPIFGGDPRGCVFKLKLPSGQTNDFGREGWCVPR